MDGKETLALVNALLNSVSTVLLLMAFVQIKKGNRVVHGRLMVSALVVSTAFLACYLTSYYVYGDRTTDSIGVIPLWLKYSYLIFLAAHVLMAIVMLPFIALAVWFAARGRYETHKKFSRPAWWMWMYVSVTGVIVYLVLYHLLPAVAVKEAA
jgi:putative membrane protein